MAQKKKDSSSKDDAKLNAQDARMHAKMQKERQKAARKREKDKARQMRDAERYEQQAAEARKKAAAARALREKQEADPKYQAKIAREQQRLKAKGKKAMERNQRESAKKAARAARDKDKLAAKRQKDKAKEQVGFSGRAKKRTGTFAARSSAAAQRTSRVRRAPDTQSKRNRSATSCLVAMLVVAVLCAIALWPPQDTITMGLDIQGGLSVNLSAKTDDGGDPTADQMDETLQVITSRVNASGASASSVQQQGTNSFLVQVPGSDEEQNESILNTLSSQGVLKFVRVDEINDDDVKEYIEDNITGMNLDDPNMDGDTSDAIDYTDATFMTGDSVTQTTVARPQGSADYAVNLTLDSTGTSEFADVTNELVSDHGQIAIVLDGVVESAPAVQSAITNGEVQITGDYTSEEANDLKAIIDSGSLPVSLQVESSSEVGPTIGNNALWVGITSAGIGLAIVIIWLLLFYRGLGLLTGVSIIIMSIVYLGVLALLSSAGWFSLTLPGIAGIIVNIGMSADSSILIMECFHEQIRQGKSIKTASQSGVHEGIFTSIDADVVTLVSALVLYFLAVGDVRGFGLTLAIGICCDLLIMALFSGPIIRILGPGIIARHPGFWGIRDDVNQGAYVGKEAS